MVALSALTISSDPLLTLIFRFFKSWSAFTSAYLHTTFRLASAGMYSVNSRRRLLLLYTLLPFSSNTAVLLPMDEDKPRAEPTALPHQSLTVASLNPPL